MPDTPSSFAGDRLAKVIARAGLCSRRDAEDWIRDGRVAVNGKTIRTPAFNVTDKDTIKVDGNVLAARQGTRVWLYHKPPGLVVTEKDPEGRPTVFETLEQHGLPRVVSIGRLDINTEGLLLLTNDGGLKRVLELPATGWLRRYRVRAFGTITQEQLNQLKDGIEVDGVNYGPIEASLEREQGSNVWLQLALREGKNREVKNVLEALGLKVNRLIRISFGPFQLSDLPIGAVEVVRARVLREQLGKRLADEAGVDFDSDLPEPAAIKRARTANPKLRAAAPGKEPRAQRSSVAANNERFHFTDRSDGGSRGRPREEDRPPRKDRPGRPDPRGPKKPPRGEAVEEGPKRKIHFEDGRDAPFEEKLYGKKPARGAKPAGDKPPFKKAFGDKPKREYGSRDSSPTKRGRGTGPQRLGLATEGREGQSTRNFAGGGGGPKRDFADRPKRPYAADSDRPKRPYTPRSDGADRPKRPYAARADGDRPKRPFAADSDRPKRAYAPRSADGSPPPRREYSDKPRGNFADRPKRDFSDRPKRDYGAKPSRPARSFDDKPKRSFADKPRSGPASDKPKRPRGSGPGGDRPRRPRPPKA